MRIHAFEEVGGNTRSHPIGSRSWTHTARQLAVALSAAALALAGGPAIAHADGPAGAYSNGPVSFYDQWIAHDSELQLAQGDVGTFTLGDGAMNTDQWSVTWKKNPSDSVTITLANLIARSGPGMGNVGDQYIATIQPDPTGFQLLYLHGIGAGQPVMTFCTPQEMKAPNTPIACRT
jgi:hypothetical protein